uniref:Uncharacterized protein n=1 Tax=Populus davidiana TaxID=266767 RepID=A0A6M2F156_9ROSI
MIKQFLKTLVSNSDLVVTNSYTEYLNIPRVYFHHIHHTSSNTSMSHKKQLQVPSNPVSFSTALAFLQSIVVQKLLNKVDMSHEHSSTAIPNQPQRIKSISFSVISLEKIKIRIPFVPNHLAASETTNWDNHLWLSLSRVR